MLPQLEELKYFEVLLTSWGIKERAVVVKRELNQKALFLIGQSRSLPSPVVPNFVHSFRIAEMRFFCRVGRSSFRRRARSSVIWEEGAELLLLHIGRSHLRVSGNLDRMFDGCLSRECSHQVGPDLGPAEEIVSLS